MDVYLDNAASTMIHPRVDEEMKSWSGYANAGSIHSVGIESKKKITEARQKFASLLNCDEDQIIFTSGGSESNATVLRGFESMYGARGYEKTYAISKIEHESVIKSALYAHMGKMFDEPWAIDVDSKGIASLESLEELFKTPDTDICLVSVMAANNEIPAINPIKEFAELSHEYGAAFHTDCVQAVGSIDLDTKAIGCDFLSLSAHKFHGPKGIGVLYCKDKQQLVPLIAGGSDQEFGVRGGTENVPAIIGAGVAAEIAKNEQNEALSKVRLAKHSFYSAFTSFMNLRGMSEKVRTNGDFDDDRTKVVSLTIDGVDAQTLVLMASTKGLYISAGSACNSHETRSSHVLKAIGLTDEQAHSTVRLSFSRFTGELDAVSAALVLSECIADILRGAV